MLKITTTPSQRGTTLRLEGRIVGDWVGELSRAVAAARPAANPIALDLSGVTFVDASGAVFLRSAAASGIGLANPSEFISDLIRGEQP